MAKNEKTSKRVGKIAGKALRDSKSTRITRELAASALTQVADRKKRRTKKG